MQCRIRIADAVHTFGERFLVTGGLLTVVPRTDLRDKNKVSKELVVDDVVVASEPPEQVGPRSVNFLRKFLDAVWTGVLQELLEPCLEVLERRERFPTRVH